MPVPNLDNIVFLQEVRERREEAKEYSQPKYQELEKHTFIGASLAVATTALGLGLAYYNGLNAAPLSWLAGDTEYNAAFFDRIVYRAWLDDNPELAKWWALGVGGFTGLTVGLHLMLGVVSYSLLKRPKNSPGIAER